MQLVDLSMEHCGRYFISKQAQREAEESPSLQTYCVKILRALYKEEFLIFCTCRGSGRGNLDGHKRASIPESALKVLLGLS
jgi:hypothetical protein